MERTLKKMETIHESTLKKMETIHESTLEKMEIIYERTNTKLTKLLWFIGLVSLLVIVSEFLLSS